MKKRKSQQPRGPKNSTQSRSGKQFTRKDDRKGGAKPVKKAAGKSPKKSHAKPEAHSGPQLHRADLYGTHAVCEAWLNPVRQVRQLYCTAQALEGFAETLEAAKTKGLARPDPVTVDKMALEKALPQGAVHQGLALVCGPLPETGLEDLIIRERDKERSLLVILDQVTDPHNVGAILRSACAFGAAGLVMQKKHAPELEGPAGGVLAKAACGALEHVPVAYETNLSRSIEALQEAGYFVYGLDERGDDITGLKNLGGKSALVLGAEGPGLRRLVKEHCDALVRLPMRGPMPSINVSNAAAVALHEFSKG